MKERGLIVVSLNEIAERWQVPVSVIQYFITDCGMPVEEKERGRWFAEHTDLILEEKRKAFEKVLFPEHLRREHTENIP
jgi:hypothetical protein